MLEDIVIELIYEFCLNFLELLLPATGC